MRALALAVFFIVASAAHAMKLGGGEPVDLYDANDKMALLSNLTFRTDVYNKPNVWLVEFYNSWCGFCQRFAPTWKIFAANVYNWNGVVSIGAVDCAKPDNNPLCREVEIMSYPSLRVFAPMAKEGDLGTDLKAEKTVASITGSLLDFIEKEQLEGKGGKGWPTLIPYRNSELNNIWVQVPTKIQHTFLIFEEATSYMGREVILDFIKVKNIQIRRVTTNNEAMAKLIEINNFPSLAVLKRDMSVVHLLPKSKTRDGYASSVHSFLSQEGVIEDVNAFREIPREQVYYGRQEKPQEGKPLNVPDVVYRVDLENTLRFSLKHEIAMHRVIEGETFQALLSYLRVLASFFPTKPQGTMFLERLRDWVAASAPSVKGEDFLEKVNALELSMNFVIPDNQDWIGCRGSSHKFRGYTCGLWTLFHSLTVGAASQTKRRVTPGSDMVLKAILLYVRHFFGCAGCSKHFQEMAADRGLQEVSGLNEAALWLWEAHNVVNKRLKGDLTEDPAHPKIQFPSLVACMTCKGVGEDWEQDEVLGYLKQRYSKSNICPYELNSANMCQPITENLVRSERTAEKLVDENIDALEGSGFNYADIGLCVVLYMASAIVLILVYYKFVLKRGHKRKFNVN